MEITNKEKVKLKFPKAYSFKRHAGNWNPTYDIISEPNHVTARILSSSFVSFKEAWKKAAQATS